MRGGTSVRTAMVAAIAAVVMASCATGVPRAVVTSSTVPAASSIAPSDATSAAAPDIASTVPTTPAVVATSTPGAVAVTIAGTTATAPTTASAALAAGTTTTVVGAAPASSTPPMVPAALDEDVAALPDGNGARIAIVVDDVGGVEGSLADYLALPMPISLSVIPSFAHAAEHAQRVHAAGKEVLMHLPLANRRGNGDGVTRLVGTESVEQVDAFVQAAVEQVPYAVGANNHEGPYGSAQPALMRALLASLRQRGLFFMDSVTSQRSVGYAVEGELGMDRRVNNQFLDHEETDENSRVALLHLATLAAASGSGIGICHVYHPFALHALQAIGAQLAAKGYVFAPLSAVTNHLQGGLDAGMRSSIPAG